MTIDFEKRLMSYNVCDPFDRFEYKAGRVVDNRRLAEATLKQRLSSAAGAYKGEWYKVSEDILFENFYSV
jgi:hypothetical protein